MKKFMKVAALATAGLMLTGCTFGGTTQPSSDITEVIIEPYSDEPISVDQATEEPPVTEENYISDVNFEIVVDQDTCRTQGKLTWMRGDVDCFYDSPMLDMTELDNVQDVGLVGENMYYFIAGCKLYMIDLTTGQNIGPADANVGASCHWDFDEHNTIYICGYYGPDLAVITESGQELVTYGALGENIWPYEIKYEDGFVYITYDQEPQVLKVNPEDGSYTVVEE